MMSKISWLLLAPLIVSCSKGAGGEPPAKSPPPAAADKTKPSAAAVKEAAAKPEGEEKPDWEAAISHEVRYDTKSASLVVDVSVKPGFHAYTVGETIGRPLKLELDEMKSGWVADGEIKYPEGKKKELPLGTSVIVEGDAEVTAKLKKNDKNDAKEAVGKFQYQVCTEEACDRPRTATFMVAVNPK